ncbi:hypothetical protein SAMN04487969_11930 [Paenibacillus algorifonticola]|uniref:Uncharacterized protein n=1 Tax=Paenibacillus algorifonticola TaxID=684063 RepID=A0A1I2GZL3_9BACL|nr:hypothetical protein [Paenibacillus algorifonticola]SFF22590.1 hypothetical protein SAMN04487969_11930 [Paenibacillus algorifonticola]
MSKTELDEATDRIVKYLHTEFLQAAEGGEEQLQRFLSATVFTIGSFIPSSVEKESIIPFTTTIMEAVAAGIQTGLKIANVPGELTIVTGRRSS